MSKYIKKAHSVFTVMAALFILSCSSSTEVEETFVSDWISAEPSEQGFDAEQLDSALLPSNTTGHLRSIVIIRNGYLVAERYYAGTDQTTLFDVRSVTKSVSSLLIGKAVDQGFIAGTAQKLVDLIPVYATFNTDPRYQEITLADILTMRTGYQWAELIQGAEFGAAPHHIEYVLGRKFDAEPGNRFLYDSASAHLISSIITRTTGFTTLDYAKNELFRPLNIEYATWALDHQGYVFTGSGLSLRAQDLAKIGFLFLNNGYWKNTKTISENWLEQSLHPHVDLETSWGTLNEIKYGYMWWLAKINEIDVAFALGYGGQYIMVIPEYNMVIVATSDFNYPPTEADYNERVVLSVIKNKILPAMTN